MKHTYGCDIWMGGIELQVIACHGLSVLARAKDIQSELDLCQNILLSCIFKRRRHVEHLHTFENIVFLIGHKLCYVLFARKPPLCLDLMVGC